MKTSTLEIGKRIKMLRKEEGLTQTQFGERIGVKGNTVTGYENGTRRPSDSVLNYICVIFNINQTWLRTGEGDMRLADSIELDELSQIHLKFNCNNLEMKFLTAYLDLKEKERDAFCELLVKMFPQAISAIVGKNPLERAWKEALPLSEVNATLKDDSTEAEEANYRSSSGFVQSMGLSASNTTEDTASPNDKPKEKTTTESGGGESGNNAIG